MQTKTFAIIALLGIAMAIEINQQGGSVESDNLNQVNQDSLSLGLAQTTSIHQSLGGDTVHVTWHNIGSRPAQMVWHHYNGDEWPYYSFLNADASSGQQSSTNHVWSASNDNDYCTLNGKQHLALENFHDQQTIEVKCEPETFTVTGNLGTIFLDRSWIVDDEQTAFHTMSIASSCTRNMYDRRDNRYAQRPAWCIQVYFKPDNVSSFSTTWPQAEFKVNRDDFTENEAIQHAYYYGKAVGRLPAIFRADLDTVTINDGNQPFGGGSRDILIHHGSYYADDEQYGWLEETLLHEAAHTSLDSHLYGTPKWIQAVEDDGIYISDYARDNPQREDVSETSVVWFATRYGSQHFSTTELADWNNYMGNRFAVFDDLVSSDSRLMFPWSL